MRWLACAASGLPFADLNVITFGFTPDDAMPFFSAKTPPLISAGNAGKRGGAFPRLRDTPTSRT